MVDYSNCRCPKINNRDNFDKCDVQKYRNMIYNYFSCYNYIPNNYYFFIGHKNEQLTDMNTYSNTIIVNNSESENEICIFPLENIFSIIKPEDLIKKDNPVLLYMNPKKIILRVRYKNSKIKKIYNNFGEEIPIIFILCSDENLLIYDIFDLNNNKYLFQIYKKSGNNFNTFTCDNFARCKTNYYLGSTIKCEECPIQCSQCTYESVQLGLCIQSNNNNNYYEQIIDYSHENLFVKCINEETKPYNYILNKNKLRYELCFETCENCFDSGDEKRHPADPPRDSDLRRLAVFQRRYGGGQRLSRRIYERLFMGNLH